MNNVRNYTDKEILDRVRSLPSFNGTIPDNYWLIGVRSNEDKFNQFDDKFYLFKGSKCISSYHCTTNAGTDLLNPSNTRGEAVLKSDGIYYESHLRRKHRGKVMAYCQQKALPIFRDNDRDRNIEELGTAKMELVGINIHPSSYQFGNEAEREFIQGWSQGCQVFAVRSDFDKFMKLTTGQQTLTYCLLKEFNPQDTKVSAAAAPKSGADITKTESLTLDTSPDNQTDSVETDSTPPPNISEPAPMPESLTAIPTQVVEVEQVVAASDAPKDPPKEDALTRIGNKAVALWAALGTALMAVGSWFASLPRELVIAVVGGGVIIGVAVMVIKAARQNAKDKLNAAAQLETARLDAELKIQREKQAFELQKLTLESAMSKDMNTVRIVPTPPVTEIQNSDSEK